MSSEENKEEIQDGEETFGAGTIEEDQNEDLTSPITPDIVSPDPDTATFSAGDGEKNGEGGEE